MVARIEKLEGRQLLVSAALVEVPITAAAIAADPALSGYRTYDVVVSMNASGDDFTNGELRVQLASGQYYLPSPGNSNVAQQVLWPSVPNLQFDTFVASPDAAPTVILGGGMPASPMAAFSSTLVSASFAPDPFQFPPPGTLPHWNARSFTLARLTVTESASGYLVGQVWTAGPGGTGSNNPLQLAMSINGGSNTLYTPSASIGGRFENGMTDAPLSGWRAFADTQRNGTYEQGADPSAVSASNGNFTIGGLLPGEYQIRYVTKQGWYPHEGSATTYTVTVGNGQSKQAGTFAVDEGDAGPAVLGSIKGKVQELTGIQVGSGWRVYIDGNNNGRFDSAGEGATTTSTSGSFYLDSLASGIYRVRLELRQNFSWAPNASTSRLVSLSAGESETVAPFMVAVMQSASAISGNLTGVAAAGASSLPLKDWRVYVDQNMNGQFDASEPSRLTSSAGGYTLDNLAAGTHAVRAVVPSGWRAATGQPDMLLVTTTGGQTRTGNHFAFTRTARLSGRIFHDRNGNGARDANDGGVAGLRVYIDKNNNGKLDSGEKSIYTSPSGYWSFDDLSAGTYIVRVKSSPAWVYTTNRRRTITVGSGGTSTSTKFGVIES